MQSSVIVPGLSLKQILFCVIPEGEGRKCRHWDFKARGGGGGGREQFPLPCRL